MHLPGAASAVLDIRKLENYCLDVHHPLGRHKARVFEAALSVTATDAEWLRRKILQGVRSADAQELSRDSFGVRYAVDLALTRHERQAVVRTAWIASEPDHVPRFVTCWIL